jgi:hypothetical protein
MKINFKKNLSLLLFLSLITHGCTEPYILETNTYEEALVVEATITNEFKKQEIILTKTARLEDKKTAIESGAEVYITDNTGIRYDFEEDSEKYISTVEFQAIPGKEYQLNINTKDGRTFESSTEILSPINPMQDVKAVVKTKDSIRGIGIHVYNNYPTNNANYYRLEYEETYKIITPHRSFETALYIPSDNSSIPPRFEIIPNTKDSKVCFSSKKNTDILLYSNVELKENSGYFPIRFISDQNYIISHRYSIFVKQYIENLASYTFYKTLKKISESGSLLSPLQPGFIYGNIKPIKNPNDKIIGFFNVASVSSKRIYFNYVDLFPKEPLPPYYTECTLMTYNGCFRGIECDGRNLVTWFNNNTLTFAYGGLGDTINVYPAPCGDCTTFSSNVKPTFWQD